MGIVLEDILKTNNVGGFVIIVQFTQNTFSEFIDDINDVDGCQFRILFSEFSRQIVHQVEIELDGLVDVRAANFDDNVFTVF